MSDILVKAAATAHEAYIRRGELPGMARKAWKNVRQVARELWLDWQGYVLAGLIGSVITLLILRALIAAPIEVETREQPVVLPEPIHVEEAAETAAAAPASSTGEIEALAKLLYCMVPTHSRDDQEAVCWCVINRAESSLYPDSIEDVVEQPSQWVGYAAGAPVVQQYYDVAKDVLEQWHGGAVRPCGPEFLWLDWSKTDVELRNSFEITKSTRYWG